MSIGNYGRTHWDGCWRDPKHHACAIAKIEELLQLVDEMQDYIRTGDSVSPGQLAKWVSVLRQQADGAQPDQVQAVALGPIERLESYDRTYIPLPGGWEIQTKGRGSTFRLCDTKTGDRLAVPDQPYLHETIERMAREIHAAVSVPPAAPSDGAMAQAVRELRERKMSTFMHSAYANGWHEALTAVEHMAREIAEGEK